MDIDLKHVKYTLSDKKCLVWNAGSKQVTPGPQLKIVTVSVRTQSSLESSKQIDCPCL